MKNPFFILPYLLILLLLISCGKSNRFGIDTSNNRVEVKIHRFDKDLITLDKTNPKAGVILLYNRYPHFLPIYIEQILETATTDTLAVSNLFVKFLNDTVFAKVNKKTMETFGDISDIEKSVSDAYSYIHYYFPDVKLPEIYFFVSGFNRSALLNNQFISIGSDFYLGSDFPSYKSITYKYLLLNMRRERVATDLVSATLFRMFVMNKNQDRLLDNIIFRGKVMYLLSAFIPSEKAENLMGYTPEQWKWCKEYQKQIWATMIDKKDLFSSDQHLIGKYLNDAPFTAPISQQSPGRLGTWIGWQIVNSYMKKNEKVGLRDLMDQNNSQKILEESGYKP